MYALGVYIYICNLHSLYIYACFALLIYICLIVLKNYIHPLQVKEMHNFPYFFYHCKSNLIVFIKKNEDVQNSRNISEVHPVKRDIHNKCARIQTQVQ